MDYSKIKKINCKNDNPDLNTVQNTWMKFFSNQTSLNDYQGLIFPETNNNNFAFNKFYSMQKFSENVLKNIKLINKTNILEMENSEVKLLKKNKTYEIEINLKFNEELSEMRNNILKDDNTTNNILFLYIDALSRPHFFRKMKRLSKFLEKFNSNKTLSYESFQFLKYQSFKNDYYSSGIQTIFYQKSQESMYLKNQNTHILSLLKKQGYITGQSANYCFKEFQSIEKESNFFKSTKIEEYDHENIAMFCDPFFYDNKNSETKNIKGINSAIKRCLYGKNSFEYVLEYGYKFWTKYKNNKKFLRLGFFEGNEKTGEVIKYLDYYLYDFLTDLYEKNYLEKTIIFIVSGQGNTYNEIFNSNINYDFYIEKYIGTLFIFVDKEGLKLNDNDLINIRNNQQNMVTAFDIHETLKSIVNKNIYKDVNENEADYEYDIIGKSLFGFIETKDRNCDKFKQTSEDVCRCIEF